MDKRKHRSIEINGQIHHLFISPRKISANPCDSQVKKHMKDTVIMRDLEVHIVDENGDGSLIQSGNGKDQPVEAKEMINLAGEKGRILIQEAQSSGKLPQATYEIIEEDIIHALEERPEESLEDLSELTME